MSRVGQFLLRSICFRPVVRHGGSSPGHFQRSDPGTVGDAAGARIGASSVVLVNTATNFRYSTTTDGFGRFVFELLPPGDYSARAESPGMSPQTTPGLHVDVGGTD